MNTLERFKIIGKSTLVALAIAALFLSGAGAIVYGIEACNYIYAIAGAVNIIYGICGIVRAFTSLNKR